MTFTKNETRPCESCGHPVEHVLNGIVAGRDSYPFRWVVVSANCRNPACPDPRSAR